MKTIAELRATCVRVVGVNSWVSNFARHYKVDFEVWLPTFGVNLQRGHVWQLWQKQELIWSILKNRHIPPLSMLRLADDTFQVIDGKQRLSAMLDFYNNKFAIEIDGKQYLFKDLPKDYQREISDYGVRYNLKNEDYGETISDQYKVDWFLSINFAGTPQDVSHFETLKKNKQQ